MNINILLGINLEINPTNDNQPIFYLSYLRHPLPKPQAVFEQEQPRVLQVQ